MVFNKEKGIPHMGAGKGIMQHWIKTHCNAEKKEKGHLSCCTNVCASVSTCVWTHTQADILPFHKHWCVVIHGVRSHLNIIGPLIKVITIRINHNKCARDRLQRCSNWGPACGACVKKNKKIKNVWRHCIQDGELSLWISYL